MPPKPLLPPPMPYTADTMLGAAPYVPVSAYSAARPADFDAGSSMTAKPGGTATGRPPVVPKWVRGDPAKETRPERRESGARNAQLVQKANKDRTRYDFVLYGDSITNNLVAVKFKDAWAKSFGDLKHAAALGVGGNTVEELSWRVAVGKEKFEVAPRCVAILVGINNIKRVFTDPVERLDTFLLPWMRATWPTTKIVLLNMLPNADKDVRPFNERYRLVASKHGATYATCGADIDPRNKVDMPDGTHPSAAGYAKILPCLRRVFDELTINKMPSVDPK